MADNVTPPGLTATDELTIGGQLAHVQFVKILDGTADSTNRLVIDAQGAMYMRLEALTAGALTSVTSSATSVTLLASDANRRRYKVFNDSTSLLYLAEGAATASNTAFTVRIEPAGFWESDFDGVVSAIWSAANGAARVTAQS